MIKKTKLKRLSDYIVALIAYKISNTLPFFEEQFRTNGGFCYYFKYIGIRENYPELWETKPDIYEAGLFWFKKEYKKPRIECLKKAIKLCFKNEVII